MDDSGPAFPGQQQREDNGKWNQTWEPGLTKREWFAGQALSAARLHPLEEADALIAELAKDKDAPQPSPEPVPVIWPYRCRHDTLESVQTAWDSGLITAVAIFGGNRITSSTLYTTSTKQTCRWCREHGVPMILIRGLFPVRRNTNTTTGALVDPEFYKQEVLILQREASNLGAAWCGFDTEPYGDTPIRNYIKGGSYYSRTQEALIAAIEDAVGDVGPIDYVLPAGANNPEHPYRALAGLGGEVITEHSYYRDAPSVTYPWDIPGMFVDVVDDGNRYTVAEVFGSHAHLWADTGVFLWQENALAVARALKELGR